MDLKLTVDGLEKERDFYFSKLRDIELICQEHENENSPIITGIISVLYATEVRAGHCCLPPAPGPPSPRLLPASGLVCSLGCPGWGFGLCRSPCTVPGGDVAGAGREWEPPPHVAPGLTATRAPPPGGLCPTRGRRAGGAAAGGPGRVLAPARSRAPRRPAPFPHHRHSRSEPVRLALHCHTPSRSPAAEPTASASSSSGGKPPSP